MMLANARTSAHVPAEYVGRARVFARRCGEAGEQATAAIDGITGRLRVRWKRNPNPHPADLKVAVRDWLAVPAFGRIGVVKVALGRHHLGIAEARAVPVDFRLQDWASDASEPGVSIRSFVLVVDRRRCRSASATMAIVSLHALARRMQRGADAGDDAIMADLDAMARRAAAVRDDAAFVVRTADGGRWVGSGIEVSDGGKWRRVAAARSYLDADLAERRHDAGADQRERVVI